MTIAEIIEALRTCEHALRLAIQHNKVGWLQEAAQKQAVKVLNKADKQLTTRKEGTQ